MAAEDYLPEFPYYDDQGEEDMAPGYDPDRNSRSTGYPDDRPPPSGDPHTPPSDGGNRELTPEAEYPVVAIKHRVGYAGTGTEQVGVRLRVTDGPLKGKYLLWYGTFTDNSEEITIRALRNLGFEGDDLYDQREWDAMYARAQEATAVVQHEVYKDKKRAKVAWINGGGDVIMAREMNDHELRAFGARMRGAFKRHGGGRSSSKQNERRDDRAPPPRDTREQQRPDDRQRNFNERDQRGQQRPDDRDPWDRDQRGRDSDIPY